MGWHATLHAFVAFMAYRQDAIPDRAGRSTRTKGARQSGAGRGRACRAGLGGAGLILSLLLDRKGGLPASPCPREWGGKAGRSPSRCHTRTGANRVARKCAGHNLPVPWVKDRGDRLQGGAVPCRVGGACWVGRPAPSAGRRRRGAVRAGGGGAGPGGRGGAGPHPFCPARGSCSQTEPPTCKRVRAREGCAQHLAGTHPGLQRPPWTGAHPGLQQPPWTSRSCICLPIPVRPPSCSLRCSLFKWQRQGQRRGAAAAMIDQRSLLDGTVTKPS